MRRGRISIFVGALCVSSLLGCSTHQAPAANTGVPTIVMSTSSAGYAIWPSGARWIVLATTDGWRSVSNKTPTAVPTDGGLAIAVDGHQLLLGVGPHHLMSISPTVFSGDAGRTWLSGQLTGGLALGQHVVALSAGKTWALTHDARGQLLVGSTTAGTGWAPLVSGMTLSPSDDWQLTGVVFPEPTIGFLLGTGGSGQVYTTTDAGASWRPANLPVQPDGAATYQPCKRAGGWDLPVYAGGALTVLQAPEPAGPWRASASTKVSSAPILACSPTAIWAIDPASQRMLIFSGNVWSAGSDVPANASSLAVGADGSAVLATANPARLWRLESSATSWRAVSLPKWVGVVGGAAMSN